MQLQDLHPRQKRKPRKRVGRGGKRGTYSGRGMKGQKARAGHRLPPVIRGLIKRYPKLRGYRFKSGPSDTVGVNIGLLNKKFASGDIVTPEILLERGIIRRIKGRTPRVKILGEGEANKVLKIEKCLTSKQAREKIEKAGGTVKSIQLRGN